MKSKPITAKASPLKIKEEKSKTTTSSSTSYEADKSGNLFKVERSSSAGDMLAQGKTVQGIEVPRAQASGSKASNPDAYVAGLKKRFPNATGEDLVRGGYISSAYADKFPSSTQPSASSASSTSSSESETKTPVMRPAEPGNPGMTTDTRWNWQQKNINRTQQSQRRGNRRQARADMKYMESQGLVERTGEMGRGQGYKLTESGAANADAAKRYELNQADIFGVDQTRFTRDDRGNITGRNESYNPQDSRKNRAQTGTYDARDTYKEARPEEQWNIEKHGEYTGASSVSKSATTSASEAKSEPISMAPVTPESNRATSESMFNVNPVGQSDNAFLSGMAAGAGESMQSSANIASETPEPVLPEQKQILGEEGPLQMKYKHNPRMMYKESPAKMWGAAKTEAGDKGVFNTVKSKTAAKPITKFSNTGDFKMKGFNKK